MIFELTLYEKGPIRIKIFSETDGEKKLISIQPPDEQPRKIKAVLATLELSISNVKEASLQAKELTDELLAALRKQIDS